MTVYLEYAFAENFLLDLLLLLLALSCARAKLRALNLLAAAAVGGAEAIIFPILVLPVWCAYILKFLGGALIAVISVHKGSGKTYIITTIAFFFLTFALGGLLTALYSFFGAEVAEGNGFVVERAPVTLVLTVAGLFAFFVIKLIPILYRRVKEQKNLYECTLFGGDRAVQWKGFADSGNLLTFCSRPVCVVSAAAIFALFGSHPAEVGRIEVNTVNGGREAPVFECSGLELKGENGAYNCGRVYLTVGDVHSKEFQIILHTALTEEYYEHTVGVEKLARENSRQRKCSKLSLRKRGIAASALGRGRGGDAEKARRGRGDGSGEGEAHRA